MIRYLSGVVLLQIVTLALFWASLGSEIDEILIRSVLPAALIAWSPDSGFPASRARMVSACGPI